MFNELEKVRAFEYTLKALLAWYRDNNPNKVGNDISTLKAVKLLFFVSAANTTSEGRNFLLQNVFTRFSAMPFGHVESFIYDKLKERDGQLDFYTITSVSTVVNQGVNPEDLESQGFVNDQIKLAVNSSIKELKQNNANLINLSAFDLVTLSHRWYSWQKNFAIAQQQKKRSVQIPLADIITEHKVYSVQFF